MITAALDYKRTPDLARNLHATPQALASVRLENGYLALQWTNGITHTLHPLWLRDNCQCSQCYHPEARERIFDLQSVPHDLRVSRASVTPNRHLSLVWAPEGHRSIYDAQWLLASLSSEAAFFPARDRRPWHSDLAYRLPNLAYHAIMHDNSSLFTWCQLLRQHGVVLIHEVPAMEGEVLRVGKRIGSIWTHSESNLFDVQPKHATESLAYTSLELPLHTDLPSRVHPPAWQLLHCLQNEARGGDFILVDGLTIAAVLRENDPENYRILATVPVDFRFSTNTVDFRHRCPILSHDASGELVQIRFNTFLQTPMALPVEMMEQFYAACRAFLALTTQARFQVRLRLTSGLLVSFDNHRILHGRTSFDAQSGPRRLQSCYLDPDELDSRIRTLQPADTTGHRQRGVLKQAHY